MCHVHFPPLAQMHTMTNFTSMPMEVVSFWLKFVMKKFLFIRDLTPLQSSTPNLPGLRQLPVHPHSLTLPYKHLSPASLHAFSASKRSKFYSPIKHYSMYCTYAAILKNCAVHRFKG